MYSIAVKIEGIESRRRSTSLLHIVIGFFLIIKGAEYYRLLKYQYFTALTPVFLVASFSLFYGIFRRRLDPISKYNVIIRLVEGLTFFVLGAFMKNIGPVINFISLYIFGILCILLVFSERRIFQETTIYLNENGISIPGYYKDHFVSWNDLSDVVIRADYITLFHLKQKYLQYQVMQTLSALELAKMNAFCKEHLENKKEKKEKYEI